MPSDIPPVAPNVKDMSNTDIASVASPSTCPWPWCHSETTTTTGTNRLIAHTGAPRWVAIPPDELEVQLLAVDDQAPTVVIEPSYENQLALILAVDQAEQLAVALAVIVASANDPGRR